MSTLERVKPNVNPCSLQNLAMSTLANIQAQYPFFKIGPNSFTWTSSLIFSSPQAKTLIDDLGYTQEEASCIDPEMADLAISRRIRRPASGMPRDWLSSGDNEDYDKGIPELDLDEILYGGRETTMGRRRESRYYDDEGYYRRGEGRGSGRRRDTYNVDRQPPLPARDRRVSSRSRRKKRELDPAEAYERRLFGRGEGDGVDAEDNIWTGIGPDGPWPT